MSNEAAAIHLEAYNRQLVRKLNGDPTVCQIDAIMRLPGTINLPGWYKSNRGRFPVVARLVEFHADRRYDLKAFKSRKKARPDSMWDPELSRDALGWDQPEFDVEPTRSPF